MHLILNAAQAETWHGCENWPWAENQDRYDAVSQGLIEHLFAAAAIGTRDRVLDIGCGHGQTTRLAGRQASAGYVVGIDLPASMLERARATTAYEGLRNVRFDQGDAEIHPFPSGSFDVAISRGGLMYFADHMAAFTNIGQALRPGGRLVFLCPQSISGHDEFAHAIAPLSALMREKSASGTGLGADSTRKTMPTVSAARIEGMLTVAGFSEVTHTIVEAPMILGRDPDDASEFMFDWGLARSTLGDTHQQTVDSVHDALATALRRYTGPDGVRVVGIAWLVTAVWPDAGSPAGT